MARKLLITPNNTSTVKSDFLAVFKKTLDTVKLPDRMDPKRVISLRCSQLPYCPLNSFYKVGMTGLYREMDMLGSYYTKVGTTVHEVMQTYLGTSGRFLADWWCPCCKKTRKMSHEPYCCDTLSHYNEVLIDHAGVVGHIDGIYKDVKGRYWILDFKTTSLSGIKGKLKDPGVVYKEQIEAYAYLLFKQYGIKVVGVMLVFVPRDDPKKSDVYTHSIDANKFDAIKARLAHYRKMHRAVMNAKTKEDVKALLRFGRCDNPYCDTCGEQDESIKLRLKTAYQRAKAAKRLPIGEFAQRAIDKAKASAKRSSEAVAHE